MRCVFVSVPLYQSITNSDKMDAFKSILKQEQLHQKQIDEFIINEIGIRSFSSSNECVSDILDDHLVIYDRGILAGVFEDMPPDKILFNESEYGHHFVMIEISLADDGR